MADQKLTALTEDTTPSSSDLAYTVKDPAGTPLSRKATWLNVFKGQVLGLLTSDNDIMARISGAATRVPVAASTFLGRKASGDVTAMTLTEAAALLGPSIPGSLIGFTAYTPGSDTGTVPSSGSTYVDVDATNLVVTFTVPPSGKVVVRLTAMAYNDDSILGWGLREGSTNIINAYASEGNFSGAPSTMIPVTSRPFYVTGLTPGDSKTYKWSHARLSGSTCSTRYGPNWGAATMEVTVGI